MRSSNIPDGKVVNRLLPKYSVCRLVRSSNIPDGKVVTRLLKPNLKSSVCRLMSPSKSPACRKGSPSPSSLSRSSSFTRRSCIKFREVMPLSWARLVTWLYCVTLDPNASRILSATAVVRPWRTEPGLFTVPSGGGVCAVEGCGGKIAASRPIASNELIRVLCVFVMIVSPKRMLSIFIATPYFF